MIVLQERLRLEPRRGCSLASVRISGIKVFMSGQETLIPKKKRGPVPTGQGTPIMVRVQPDQLASLDAWIKYQPEELSRPEAVRRLMELGLKGR